MTKPVTIKATVFWAQLNKVNDLSGKYQVDLAELSDQAVEALEEMGIAVKNKGDEKGSFITCKSNIPIKAHTKDGMLITEETNIGNGSQSVATVSFYDWTFRNNKGRSPSLKQLVITDLVEYVSEGDAVEVDESEAL